MSFKKLIITILVLFLFQSCEISRMVYYNFADINDYKIFPNRDIKKGDKTFYFPKSRNPQYPKSIQMDSTAETIDFDDFLVQDKTVAFIIIHNDSIQYEKYFDGYDESSIVPTFSMAKSVLSMLIGIAVDEGYIDSVNDSIGKYIPDLKYEKTRNTTILQLLQMTSGLKFNENYFDPFSEVAGFYYGRNLRKRTKNLKIKDSTDYKFDYKSGNSQLLGLVLDRALPEGMTISHYLQEKIWQPLQMEYDASWSVDDKKDHQIEKTYCCLNGRAIDYAKLGRLYLNKGKFNGEQIVPKEWVIQSTKVDSTHNSSWHYQYQWWIPTKNGDFYADGLLGQYIYVNPQKNLIIVRLGKNRKQDWPKIFVSLAEAY